MPHLLFYHEYSFILMPVHQSIHLKIEKISRASNTKRFTGWSEEEKCKITNSWYIFVFVYILVLVAKALLSDQPYSHKYHSNTTVTYILIKVYRWPNIYFACLINDQKND